MVNIVIIGGGLSGTLLAWNILRHSHGGNEINLKIIDSRAENDLGAAYSAVEDYHLLNVFTERMGADPENPRDFLEWALGKGIEAKEGGFLPRSLYRKYIHELFQEALNCKNNKITFERLHDEVTAVKAQYNRVNIITNHHGTLSADKVILALGNFLPKNLSLGNNSYLNSKRYQRNPWKPDLFDSITGNEHVVILGTGQTTIDLIISLYYRKHKGKITAISRHGHFPLVHKKINEFPSFYSDIIKIKSINEIFRFIRKQIAQADKTGSDLRAVIDSIRPYSNELWLGLHVDEKKRFIRHLFRYWEIVRSRMAPVNEELLKELMQKGQLRIAAGKVSEIIENEDSIDVHFQPKGNRGPEEIKAALAVNCTGPQVDYSGIEHPLIRNMIEQGLLDCDPLHLGINAKPDGRLITKDGLISDAFYTLGPPLRGILWECVAVPDIKLQAEALALLLLKTV